MTTRRQKTVQDHVYAALQFLDQSDLEFAAGDNRQGSEKLWGAVTQAVMAVAKQRGWDWGKHGARRVAVSRLDEEAPSYKFNLGFFAAHQFHANFYHDFMEDDEIAQGRPLVSQFVRDILSLIDEN